MLKIKTNNRTKALEVVSAQNLFDVDAELEIISMGSAKYAMSDIDAKVKFNNIEVILFMDNGYKNIDLKSLLTKDFSSVEITEYKFDYFKNCLTGEVSNE